MSADELAVFQFHKGTIRTDVDASSKPPLPYFNSIKVRLEPGGSGEGEGGKSDFNSIKVRLEQWQV